MKMQTQINVAQAFGMVGEMFDLTPRRVDAKEVAVAVTIGGVAGAKPADGTIGPMNETYSKFVGIFVRPKEMINYGGSTPLAASLSVPAGCTVQVASMGRVKVAIPAGETWVAETDVYVTAAGALTNVATSNTKIGSVVVGGAAGEVGAIEIGCC
jgi:hypothetical protein